MEAIPLPWGRGMDPCGAWQGEGAMRRRLGPLTRTRRQARLDPSPEGRGMFRVNAQLFAAPTPDHGFVILGIH